MLKLFGIKKRSEEKTAVVSKPNADAEVTESFDKLKGDLDMTELKIAKAERRIREAKEEAKMKFMANDERGGRVLAARVNMHKNTLNTLQIFKHKLEEQIATLESSQYSNEFLQSMKVAMNGHKARDFDLDVASDLMEDTRMSMVKQTEFAAMLNNSVTLDYDDSLQNEIAELQAEAQLEKMGMMEEALGPQSGKKAQSPAQAQLVASAKDDSEEEKLLTLMGA